MSERGTYFPLWVLILFSLIGNICDLIKVIKSANYDSYNLLRYFRTCLWNKRVRRFANFHVHGREESCIPTPPIGNWNPLCWGNSVHFFSFAAKKMCCNKQWNNELHGNSEQISSLSWNPSHIDAPLWYIYLWCFHV